MDDLLVSREIDQKINEFKEKMKLLFEISNLGLLSSYLGILVKQFKEEITLYQKSFALKILYVFNMQDSYSSQTPLEVRPSFGQKGREIQ